ncbi:MAG: PorP/SprF family type IX secretion system membrane protein [Saprospiraceae bacterium]|nr:PorP/SprF family type IX secretion system membrane protein [Saprospiraceae bacterium]
MKIYKGLLGFIIGFLPVLSGAQESSQYTLFMFHKYAMNPAYAGLESTLSVTGGYRAQWQELAGNPTSRLVHAHLPLYYVKGAAGLKLEQETFGVEKTLRASLSYNYVYESQIGIFSFGMGLGFIQKSLDGSQLRTPGGRYEGGIILHQDDILFESQLSGLAPLISTGIYFAQDKLELGLSLDNFQTPTIKFNRGKSSYSIPPRLNFYGEYRLDISEELVITPALLIKSDFDRVQADFAAVASINRTISAGLGFRGYSQNTLDAITVIGGLRVNPQIQIVYGLDLSLSPIKDYHQGTHELMINYNLNKKIGGIEKEPIIFNPRY